MKKQWTAPQAQGEEFLANEYVAGCEITVTDSAVKLRDGRFVKDEFDDGKYDPKIDNETMFINHSGCVDGEKFTSINDKPDFHLWYLKPNEDPIYVSYWYGPYNSGHYDHATIAYDAKNKS